MLWSLLRSLITHTYADIKVSCNNGSPKSPLSFIFSAAKDTNYKIYPTKVWSHLPIPTVFLATPSFLTVIWLHFNWLWKKWFSTVLYPVWEEQTVTLSLISLNIEMVKIEDLLQNQHLPSQIAPRNEYYNCYSFAFHFHFELSAMYWNSVWTGSVQNVDQKTVLTPEVTNQHWVLWDKTCVPLHKSQRASQSDPELSRNLDPGTTPFPFLTSSSPESHIDPRARIPLQHVHSEFRPVQTFHLSGHWGESPVAGPISWSAHNHAQPLHYNASPEIFKTHFQFQPHFLPPWSIPNHGISIPVWAIG